MIYYRIKYNCKIAEIWYNFDEKPDINTDILRYKFVSDFKKKPYSLEELFTLRLDLSKSSEELFSSIKKNTRYEINRAQNRDKIKCQTFFLKNETNFDKINNFINYFNKFADTKGRNHLNYQDIEQFYITNNFCIRYSSSEDDSIIYCMHSYVISDNIARLLQSASLFREANDTEFKNLNARANRLLHWDDILFFKKDNYSFYDFGGWYGGQELKEQLLINTFKESFGGEKKSEYSYIVPVTLKGFFYIRSRDFSKNIISIFRKHV